jgi:hypothetical protein
MKQDTWTRDMAFSRAARLILDGIEEAFDLVAPDGRDKTMTAVINVLEYYCVPKDGPDGTSEIEKRTAAISARKLRESIEEGTWCAACNSPVGDCDCEGFPHGLTEDEAYERDKGLEP